MKKFISKLTRASGYSYTITVPKELVKKFKWKEKQKLEVVFSGKKREFTVRDWKKK